MSEELVEQPAEVTEDASGPDVADDNESPNSREARLRVAAKEAKAESAALREKISKLQIGAIEKHVEERLNNVADLWPHVRVEDFLSEEGDVDFDKVNEAIDVIAKERPHFMRKRLPAPDYTQGSSGRPKNRDYGWQEVLKGGQL